MKTVLLALVLFSTFAYGQQPYVYVKGAGDKLYSARELEQIGRDYVKERKMQFSQDGTKTIVYVNSGGSNIMATVSFSAGVGSGSVVVDIDRHGKVVTNQVGVAARRGHVGNSEPGDPGNSSLSRTNQVQRAPR